MDIASQDDKIKQFVSFQINRKVKNLYKQFLFILEDFRDKKDNSVTPEIYEQARKRVLDLGNDTIREIEEAINQLDIQLKK